MGERRHGRHRIGRFASPALIGACVILVMIGWLTLAGCSTPPSPSLPPAPDRVGVSAALEAFALARVMAYSQSAGVPSFDLEVWADAESIPATADGRLQLLISAAPPPSGWFATPLGYETIAVVVNPETGVRDLTLGQLRQVFSGTVTTWDAIDGPQTPIQPIIPPEGDELRRQFADLVMHGRPFPQTALLAPTPEVMVSLVSRTAGAIGFLPLSASSQGTHQVRIDGESPNSQGSTTSDYVLRFEVVATAPEEPEGGVRNWLAWLQAQP